MRLYPLSCCIFFFSMPFDFLSPLFWLLLSELGIFLSIPFIVLLDFWLLFFVPFHYWIILNVTMHRLNILLRINILFLIKVRTVEHYSYINMSSSLLCYCYSKFYFRSRISPIKRVTIFCLNYELTSKEFNKRKKCLLRIFSFYPHTYH